MVDDAVRFDIKARNRSGPAFASVDRSLRSTTRNLVAMGRAGVVAFAAFGGAAVLRQVNATVQAVAAIGDTADRVNVAAEALQVYRFALEENGGSARMMDDSLQRLNRRLGLAADGAGPAAVALERLKIETRDANGEVRDVDPVFREAIARLSEIESAAEQAAIASQLFGDDSGPKLVPLINQGIAGLDRYGRQARELGIVLEDDLVAAAQVTAREFAQIIDQMTVSFQRFVVGTVEFGKTAIENMSPPEALVGADQLRAKVEDLAAVIGSLDAALALVESGPPSGRNRIRQIQDDLTAAKNEAAALDQFVSVLEHRPGLLASTIGGGAGGAGGGAGDDFSGQSQRVIESLQFQAEQLGRTAEQQRIYNELRSAAAELDSAAGSRIAELVTQIQALEAAEAARAESTLAAIAQQTEIERLYASTRTPLENYSAEVERLNGLLETGVIEMDLYQRAIEQAQEKLERAAEKSRDLSDVIAEGIGGAIRGNIKDWDDFKRAALRALGDVIAEALRLKAIQGGGGGGGGNIIGSLITAGASLLGLQHGGRFVVGGSGGPDSQFVPMMLSPKEEVTVRTPAQQRQGGGASGGSVNIVQNIDARGADPQSAANLRATANKLKDETIRAIVQSSNDGGAVAFALGRRRR